jgi:uncharacterized protein DUF6636
LLVAVVVIAGVAPAAAARVHFSTPSRNIGCIGDASLLRCDIQRTATKPPPKPRSCRFDWGNYFELRPRGRPRRLCVSDSALGGRRILGYGRTLRLGRMSCVSRRTGLTCRNADGHGFFLSRQRVRLF